MLDLAVALKVGDRGVVDVDGVVMTEISKGRTSKGCAQISDGLVRYTKAVCYVLHKFCRFF
jgi:hypothetical protein